MGASCRVQCLILVPPTFTQTHEIIWSVVRTHIFHCPYSSLWSPYKQKTAHHRYEHLLKRLKLIKNWLLGQVHHININTIIIPTIYSHIYSIKTFHQSFPAMSFSGPPSSSARKRPRARKASIRWRSSSASCSPGQIFNHHASWNQKILEKWRFLKGGDPHFFHHDVQSHGHPESSMTWLIWCYPHDLGNVHASMKHDWTNQQI